MWHWLTLFRRVKFGQMETRLRVPEMRFRAAQRMAEQIQIKSVGREALGEGESRCACADVPSVARVRNIFYSVKWKLAGGASTRTLRCCSAHPAWGTWRGRRSTASPRARFRPSSILRFPLKFR
jgi:hypothetical protein